MVIQWKNQVDFFMGYDEFLSPGKLTVSRSPHQAELDDRMCSVFFNPNVVRLVADRMGFEYLSRTPATSDPYPNIKGIFHGHLDRIVLPVIVEEFRVNKLATDPGDRLSIVMMYDTGSSLTYLTKEVLESLGFKPDYDILLRDKLYDVKLNGRTLQVSLCPKESCEHVCLLGQNYFSDHKLSVSIDYKQRCVLVSS